MGEQKDNNYTGVVIAILIVVGALYCLFKYLGSFLGYASILTGISYIIYSLVKKNFTKQTWIYSSIIFGVGLLSFTLNASFNYSHCECHDILMAEYNIYKDFDRGAAADCIEKWNDEAEDYRAYLRKNNRKNELGNTVHYSNYFSLRCEGR